MSTSLWPRSLALVGALAIGLLGSGLGSGGCLLLDYCIVNATPGTDWCTEMQGALMWPPGQPELAEPVVVDEGLALPQSCVCMNDGEYEILDDELPAEQHLALSAEIEDAMRETCLSHVTPGWEHNCYYFQDTLDIAAPTFEIPFPGGDSRACKGSCSYGLEPPFGSCGPDPDPWECNEEDPPFGEGTGGADETGGDETGGTGGLGPGQLGEGNVAR